MGKLLTQMESIEKKGRQKEDEGKALLTLLKRTKEGKYATIAKGSLDHLREKAQREPLYGDEEYYYSISDGGLEIFQKQLASYEDGVFFSI